MTLILASASPRRRELLSRLGVAYEVVPSAIAEREPRTGEDPAAYSLFLARAKAEDVARTYPDLPVLAADTVVSVDGMILGKPRDRKDACRMLGLLRGQSHTVVTSVAVRYRDRAGSASVAAAVRMRAFSDAEMHAYVETGEPMDKAGAYAVQGLGGQLVEDVVGPWDTVVGLPLAATSQLLQTMGVVVSVTQP